MHALVVGGTGMLAAVTRALARDGDAVSVVARRAHRIAALGVDVNPLVLDYRKQGALASAVASAQRALGPIQLVVSWIHGSAPHGHDELCASLEGPARYVRILGSAAAAPHADVPSLRYPGVVVQDVVLGFVVENGRSRWLTHVEISAGVGDAVASERPRTIVGTVEPWSMRP